MHPDQGTLLPLYRFLSEVRYSIEIQKMHNLRCRGYNTKEGLVPKWVFMDGKNIAHKRMLICPFSAKKKCQVDDLVCNCLDDKEYWVSCLCCGASGPIASSQLQAEDFWNSRTEDLAIEWTRSVGADYGGSY